MFAEVYSTACVLAVWKKNPKATKKEIGVFSAWKEDTSENNKPLTTDEVEGKKAFLLKHAPTSYYKIFPERKSKK